MMDSVSGKAFMTRTLFTLALFLAALAMSVATATGADLAPRNVESVATVDLYKDPG
jgi:hypothetical protein